MHLCCLFENGRIDTELDEDNQSGWLIFVGCWKSTVSLFAQSVGTNTRFQKKARSGMGKQWGFADELAFVDITRLCIISGHSDKTLRTQKVLMKVTCAESNN